MSRRGGPIVTIDGPAGSGKSTTARAVARRLGFRHLDSGALYRALTWALLREGVAPVEWAALDVPGLRALGVRTVATADGYRIEARDRPLGDELRSGEVTARVSSLAGLPAVRACLLDLQREAGRAGRLVADGRDMGTVVFPDAELKVYLVAELEERARRRLREGGAEEPTPGAVAEEARRLAARDRQDRERSLSPLRHPDGAWDLDTTGLTFDAQVEAVVRRAVEVLGEPSTDPGGG